MKNGICPKCESVEIYQGDSRSQVGIPTSALHVQAATTYVCVDCGYIEFYAWPGHDLEKIKDKFQKVTNG